MVVHEYSYIEWGKFRVQQACKKLYGVHCACADFVFCNDSVLR
jgi:hypothetical protein